MLKRRVLSRRAPSSLGEPPANRRRPGQLWAWPANRRVASASGAADGEKAEIEGGDRMNRSPATIFPHTPRTLLGYACSPSNAFRRPVISIVTPPGREGSRKTVTVSTRPLIASAASESPALIPFGQSVLKLVELFLIAR